MSLEKDAHEQMSDDHGSYQRPVGVPSGSLITHLVILSICGAAFGLTFFFEEVPPPLRRGMAPESFPRGVSMLAFMLTCASLFRATIAPGPKQSALPSTFYLSIAGCVLFLLVANFVDLLIAMSLFIATICWLWGERRKLFIAVLSVALPFILFILFSEFLGIRFPRGLLVNQIYG